LIRSVRFTPSSDADAERGLLAFVRFDFGPFIFDGVTLRRHADGRLGLTYPERTDRAGRRHPLVRPIDDAARREIEDAVLRELTRQELVGDQASDRGERKP
jgi:DNA-binding cell septation regulator SpoVG